VDDHGAPFFWLGDTQWELFRCFTPEEARTVLEHRKRQGFTTIQVMITGVGEGNLPNLSGELPWRGNDPAHPNEAYFRQMDRVVEVACELGLILVPGVFHQLQRSVITPANARHYARWIAERYAFEPNIVWSMYPAAEAGYVPVLRELAAGLHEGDEGAHMICVHPDPAPASSSFIHDEPWLDFNMIQTWLHYELVHEMVAADYARTPPKPVVMAEGGYEGAQSGKVHTPHLVRKQAYWSCLAGGYHSYGYNDNWESPRTWRTWIESPGAAHVGVCRQVLTGLSEWWGRVPDQSLFAGGAGSGMTLNVAARSSARDWALAYLSSNAPATIRMDGVVAGAQAEASWIDPTSGARTPIGSFPCAERRTFSPPDGWEDALLLLEPKRQDTRT
jgi:hypothetical protein